MGRRSDEQGFRDSLIRRRATINLKPAGDTAFEGPVMEVTDDGYLLRGTAASDLVFIETMESEHVKRSSVIGEVWVDRVDVLFVFSDPI